MTARLPTLMLLFATPAFADSGASTVVRSVLPGLLAGAGALIAAWWAGRRAAAPVPVPIPVRSRGDRRRRSR